MVNKTIIGVPAYDWDRVINSGGGASSSASAINVVPVNNLDSTNAQNALKELDQQKQQAFRTVADATQMCSTFLDQLGNIDYPTKGAQVYRSDIKRVMYLDATDYTNVNNWKTFVTGGNSLSLRTGNGAFDPALVDSIQYIDVDDVFNVATMVKGAKYKLIAVGTIQFTVIGGTFDDFPPSGATATQLNLEDGDSIIITLLEDGSTIQLEY